SFGGFSSAAPAGSWRRCACGGGMPASFAGSIRRSNWENLRVGRIAVQPGWRTGIMATPDTAETREAWDRIAAGYDRYVTPTHAAIAEMGLDRAGLQAGMTFLDVACGSGALSIPA